MYKRVDEYNISKSSVLAYFKGNDKSGYHVSPPWLRLFKYPVIHEAVIRDETIVETINRLKKDIDKSILKSEPNRKGKKYIGAYIDNYACVSTDGYRALLVRHADKTNIVWTICELPASNTEYVALNDPTIMAGIQRLTIVTKDNPTPAIKLAWNHKTHKLVLSTSSHDFDFEGTETYDYTGNTSGEVCLAPKYLLSVLGSWPIRMYVKSPVEPVIFGMKGGEFYYVLMPIRP
jgi:hypothetical protein